MTICKLQVVYIFGSYKLSLTIENFINVIYVFHRYFSYVCINITVNTGIIEILHWNYFFYYLEIYITTPNKFYRS